jgi:uncharacterized protein YbaP (TraB family)
VGWFRKAAVAAAAFLTLASSAQAAPAMWRVADGDSQIYLFGALHALQPTARWRTPAYDAAYAQARVIWFEADLGAADPATVHALVDRYGIDRQRALSQKLPASALQALTRQADLSRIDHLRPWAAALMLSMQPVLARGARVEAGVDMAVNRQAHAGAKEVRAFETLEDQARLFADLPEPAEVRYLSDVIRERTPHLSLQPSAGSLERAWLAGDLARLGPGLVGDLKRENPGLYDALLKRRNLAWADALSRELAQASGVELVNVGALHMVGDDGLPALLRARGFTVERVQ